MPESNSEVDAQRHMQRSRVSDALWAMRDATELSPETAGKKRQSLIWQAAAIAHEGLDLGSTPVLLPGKTVRGPEGKSARDTGILAFDTPRMGQGSLTRRQHLRHLRYLAERLDTVETIARGETPQLNRLADQMKTITLQEAADALHTIEAAQAAAANRGSAKNSERYDDPAEAATVLKTVAISLVGEVRKRLEDLHVNHGMRVPRALTTVLKRVVETNDPGTVFPEELAAADSAVEAALLRKSRRQTAVRKSLPPNTNHATSGRSVVEIPGSRRTATDRARRTATR